jgi:hypothetical protein
METIQVTKEEKKALEKMRKEKAQREIVKQGIVKCDLYRFDVDGENWVHSERLDDVIYDILTEQNDILAEQKFLTLQQKDALVKKAQKYLEDYAKKISSFFIRPLKKGDIFIYSDREWCKKDDEYFVLYEEEFLTNITEKPVKSKETK